MKHWNTKDESNRAGIPDSFFREVDIEFLIHELKGPLSVIETGMRTLLEKSDKFGDLSPKQLKTLQRSLRNTVKAREMIYSLLEIGRSEAECFECIACTPANALCDALVTALETVNTNLHDEVQTLKDPDAMADLLRANGIVLILSGPSRERLMAQDIRKLSQITGNLIKNALYYKASQIEISADVVGGQLVIDVADDGPGIDPSEHKAVFERYTQVKAQVQANRSGHGLGLAGSYILARRLGGTIDIINRDQGGAQFRLTLPMDMKNPDQKDPADTRGGTMAKPESGLKGKRILAVDDEEDILETIGDILDEVRLDTARDYESASKKIRDNRYDLAILDIMGVNGLKLLEEAVSRGIPAVMLTAHAMSPESLMESIRKGAISYLPKESLTDLDSLLTQLLDAHENGRPPWKLLFEKLGDYFDQRFGAGWKDKDKAFWTDFSTNYEISRGIRERLKTDPRILGKGI
ncbi:MAG: hybrid sensor histidine kinase/response regulator [Pseudomonadota bacterium]